MPMKELLCSVHRGTRILGGTLGRGVEGGKGVGGRGVGDGVGFSSMILQIFLFLSLQEPDHAASRFLHRA